MSFNELDVLSDIGEFGIGDPVGFDGGGAVVRCQVCAVDLDAATGEPLSPVDENNVRAAEEYVLGVGQAIQGGQQLDLTGPDLGGLGF